MSKEWLIKAMDMAFQKDKGLWSDSLLDALQGVTSEQANWKPEGKEVRSIMEIVTHIISGKKWLLSALEGKKLEYEEGSPKKPVSWEDTLKELEETHGRIVSLLKEKDINLDEKVNGEESTWGELLYGVLAHDCYHLGQIIILKSLQGI